MHFLPNRTSDEQVQVYEDFDRFHLRAALLAVLAVFEFLDLQQISIFFDSF